MLDYLKASEIIIGLVVTAVTTVAWLFLKWDKRMAERSTRSTEALDDKIGRVDRHMVERLEKFEGWGEGLEREQRLLRDRLARVETEIGRLATHEQMADLRTEIARHGEALRQIGGTVDTLYQAAIRAGEKSG